MYSTVSVWDPDPDPVGSVSFHRIRVAKINVINAHKNQPKL